MITRVSLLAALGLTIGFICALFWPVQKSTAYSAAQAEWRRELAEARMCVKQYGIGVAVVRDREGRTVCIPEKK